MKTILAAFLSGLLAGLPAAQTVTSRTASAAVPAVAGPPPRAFDDVPADHWARFAIDTLYQRGVIDGYPGDRKRFRGEEKLTRYEFAQALYKAAERIGVLSISTNRSLPPRLDEKMLEDLVKQNKIDTEDARVIRLLIEEFKKEIEAINIRVIELDRRVGEIRERKNSLPIILSGTAVFLSIIALVVSAVKK